MSMKVTRDEFVGVDRMGEDELRDLAHGLLSENERLRELAIRMRPICIQGTRCTFADKLYISKSMKELGIEVTENE